MRFFDGHYSVESLCTFKREIDHVHLEIRPMLSKASPTVFSQQSISSSSRGCLKRAEFGGKQHLQESPGLEIEDKCNHSGWLL